MNVTIVYVLVTPVLACVSESESERGDGITSWQDYNRSNLVHAYFEEICVLVYIGGRVGGRYTGEAK